MLMNNSIKIISGWSASGGSTEAFINLTNSLNTIGWNTTYYGPHSYHIDKCKSGLHKDISFNKDDILICHFIGLGCNRPPCKKIILSCHEKNLFPIHNIYN
jgi:hypothetical protein